MLKITDEQFNALEKRKIEILCQGIVTYIDEYYPSEAYRLGDYQEQYDWVTDVVEAAFEIGIEIEADIYRYVRVALTFGEDFIEEPWAKEVLDMPISAAVKSELLENDALKILAKQAKQVEKDTQRLIKQKIAQYAQEKAHYVYSFNVFYGLKLDNEQAAETWIKHMAATACDLGFTDDFQLNTLLEIALYFGKDFFAKPWAQSIINNEQPLDEKMKALHDHLRDNFGNPAARQ